MLKHAYFHQLSSVHACEACDLLTKVKQRIEEIELPCEFTGGGKTIGISEAIAVLLMLRSQHLRI